MARLVLVLVLFATFVAGACSGDEDPTGPQARILTGLSAKFTPSQITVKAHRPVQITLKNSDVVEHDWVIQGMPAINIDDDIRNAQEHSGHTHGTAEDGAIAGHAAPGQSGRVWFTPVRPGRYQFNCSVPGHRESGMVGVLIVEG